MCEREDKSAYLPVLQFDIYLFFHSYHIYVLTIYIIQHII